MNKFIKLVLNEKRCEYNIRNYKAKREIYLERTRYIKCK